MKSLHYEFMQNMIHNSIVIRILKINKLLQAHTHTHNLQGKIL